MFWKENFWNIPVPIQAVNISLCFAKKLMEHFHPGSIDFNGDIGIVKVAARRDCTEMECERLQQLAKQVSSTRHRLPSRLVSMSRRESRAIGLIFVRNVKSQKIYSLVL